MIVNGVASNATVSGGAIGMDCCDGGIVKFASDTYAEPIQFEWIAEAGPTEQLPATIDLASPSKGWSVSVRIGCDPSQASCTTTTDSYTTGFVGSLHVERAATRLDTTLCLHVAETPASPHPLAHSLDLYAPHVSTH